MNVVMLTGRLTRDPEVRSLASGKIVTTFTLQVDSTDRSSADGLVQSHTEFTNIVVWDRLAEVSGTYLGKNQQVAVRGHLQTRSWDDERNQRHWKTEVVADEIQMLTGRRTKQYREAVAAAESKAIA